MLGRARARGPQHADAVRLIHVDARAVRLGKLQRAAQVGDVAFHAEDAFGNDEDLLVRRAVLQAPLEVFHIVMTEPHRARRRPQRAFHQAGVQVVVADHDIALLGEGRERGVVGLESGAENDGGFFMNQGGQLRFELDVQVQRAVEQARTAAAAAVLADGLRGGLIDLGVGDQAEVIVRPEHQHFALPHADFARPAPFAVAKHLEVHVEPGGLQITRTSEVPAFLENVVRCAALLFAGDVASRYAHGPQFHS